MGFPDETADVKKEEKEKKDDETTPRGQKRIPGFTPKKIKALQDKGEEVLELQQRRMATEEKEREAREELLDLMKEHKLKAYPLDDEYSVVVEASDVKAFVRKNRKGQGGVKKAKEEKD